MAFCTNCGAKLADDAKFCTECGTKVESVPSEPAVQPDSTPAASVNDYTYSTPANDYTYAPPTQNIASSGSYSPEITRNTYSYDPAAASPNGTQPPRPPRDIPGGSQPEKRKSSFLPFLLIAIGVAALVFLLIGFFGSDDADDPTYGVYVASYGTYAGSRVEIEDMWPNGFSIELLSKNKCRVMVDGETETCRYELESDGEIEIDLQGDDDLEGWLVDNRLTLEDVMDSGLDLVFYKKGTVAPAVEVPAATEARQSIRRLLRQSLWSRPTPGGTATGTAGGRYTTQAVSMRISWTPGRTSVPRSGWMVRPALWISGTIPARKERTSAISM